MCVNTGNVNERVYNIVYINLVTSDTAVLPWFVSQAYSSKSHRSRNVLFSSPILPQIGIVSWIQVSAKLQNWSILFCKEIVSMFIYRLHVFYFIYQQHYHYVLMFLIHSFFYVVHMFILNIIKNICI